MNNLANQLQQHQHGNSSTIVSIPLIQQASDSNNLVSSNNINSNVNNKVLLPDIKYISSSPPYFSPKIIFLMMIIMKLKLKHTKITIYPLKIS